jgi:hypothetical protein
MEEASPVLRSQDGSTSHAPAFLQARPEPVVSPATPSPAEVIDEEVRPKVRRRRTPRSFEGADAPETLSTSGDEG